MIWWANSSRMIEGKALVKSTFAAFCPVAEAVKTPSQRSQMKHAKVAGR